MQLLKPPNEEVLTSGNFSREIYISRFESHATAKLFP
jgi:hypothetical protein